MSAVSKRDIVKRHVRRGKAEVAYKFEWDKGSADFMLHARSYEARREGQYVVIFFDIEKEMRDFPINFDGFKVRPKFVLKMYAKLPKRFHAVHQRREQMAAIRRGSPILR